MMSMRTLKKTLFAGNETFLNQSNEIVTEAVYNDVLIN
jgi:hypothetical protein